MTGSPFSAVQLSGHRFDLFVATPGPEKPARPSIHIAQDAYSGKILSWRFDLSNGQRKAS